MTVDDVPADIRNQFLDLARMLRARGFDRHSADAILHRIRWLGNVERGDREFKCNNNWTAILARWAMEFDPSLRGLFDLRERRTIDHG
jgi:hypothetical protein